MHLSFLENLADPATKEPLKLQAEKREGDFVLEGSLASSRRRYPIVRGIPRFVAFKDGKDYTTSFGYQWNRWSKVQFESANKNKAMEGHTLKMWEKITANEAADLGGATIADFGCGSGRFIEIIRMKKGRAIGIDLSDAVEAARENFRGDPEVLICQADVLNPPIRPHSLDGAFSIGVLQHTPDPARGFEEIVKTVKPGGWVAACVYGKGGYYDFPTVQLYRKLFKFLWPVFGPRLPLAYAYFAAYLLRPLAGIPILGRLLRAAFPFVKLPDRQWSLLDTFDSVTPSYQSAHESYEVYQWFRNSGLEAIAPSDWGFTAYHGVSK